MFAGTLITVSRYDKFLIPPQGMFALLPLRENVFINVCIFLVKKQTRCCVVQSSNLTVFRKQRYGMSVLKSSVDDADRLHHETEADYTPLTQKKKRDEQKCLWTPLCMFPRLIVSVWMASCYLNENKNKGQCICF